MATPIQSPQTDFNTQSAGIRGTDVDGWVSGISGADFDGVVKGPGGTDVVITRGVPNI